MKNVLVISTSMRANHNSDYLAQVFCEGAKAAGHNVEYVSLKGKKIGFCIGCSACHATKQCVLNDDAAQIIEKMKRADILVFATPLYFFEMSGQMKTLLDRTNPMFMGDYAFRDVYLLMSAHDSRETAIERCVAGLGGWIECFDKTRLAGVFCGHGFSEYGDAQKSDAAKQQVYEMGSRV